MFSLKRKAIHLSTLLTTALVLVACGGNDAAKNEERIQAYLQRADSYQDRGQYSAAIIEARNAIKLNPDRLESQVALAEIFNELGQGKMAADRLEAFTGSKDPDYILAYAQALANQGKFRSLQSFLEQTSDAVAADKELVLLKAKAEAGVGNVDASRQLYRQLLDDPEVGTEARLGLARLALRNSDKEQAQEHLAAVLEAHPENIAALALKAQIAYGEGDLEQAEDLLSQALVSMPNTDIMPPEKITVIRNLITTLTQLGRSNEALVYSQLLADASPGAEALKTKFQDAIDLFQQGKLEEAKALLLEVHESSGADSSGTLLGMISYAQGDYEAAEQYLSQHVDPEIAPAQAVRALAATRLRLNQSDELLQQLGEANLQDQNDPTVLTFVGLAQLKAGNDEKGIATLNRALEIAPEQPGPRLTLAQLYLQRDQYDKALELLEAGLELKPDDFQLHGQWINTQIAADRHEAALEHARQVAKDYGDKVEAQLLLGQTAIAAKEIDTAAKAFARAKELAPDNLQARFGAAQTALLNEKPADAKAEIVKLIEQDSDNPAAYIGLISALELAQPDINPSAVESEVRKLSDAAMAHGVLAEFYLRRGMLEDAERLAALAADQAQDPYIRRLQARVAVAHAREALAQQDYNAARVAALSGLEFDPRDPVLLTLLAKIELSAGRTLEADKIIQQIEESGSEPTLLAELRGDLAMERNKAADAAKQYAQAWQSYRTGDLASKYYQALLESNQQSEAEQLLEQWRSAAPNSAAPDIAAAMMRQSSEPKKAIELYEQALKKAPESAPENPSVMDTYGWILVQQGEVEQGIEILEAAAAKAPDSKEINEHLEQARAKS